MHFGLSSAENSSYVHVDLSPAFVSGHADVCPLFCFRRLNLLGSKRWQLLASITFRWLGIAKA